MAKIEDAIVHLLLNHGTFYASLISQMNRIEDKKLMTLEVELNNGRINLRYNPDFTNPIPIKELVLYLEHECLHLVMEHFIRFKDKDQKMSKVATDVAINQLLPSVIEGMVTIENIFQQDAYKIKREMNAEYYYDLIMKDKKLQQQIKDMFGDQLNDGNEQGKKPHTCDNDFQSQGNCEGGIDEDLQKEIIKQAVKEAKNTAEAHGRGEYPQNLEKYLDELFKPPEISWKQVLRRLVACSVKAGHKASWKKPSRRYGESQKGKVSDRTVSLVVAIDTSGSINDEMLTDFINEIRGIQACYKSDIHMIECDAEIQKYYKLTKHSKVDRNVKGRGGTDFRPVFDFIKKKNIRCDALIFFTDLCGDFPNKKPPYPTIWGYYSVWSGNPQVPFGYIIKLKKEQKK